jgi:hypothetical protein
VSVRVTAKPFTESTKQLFAFAAVDVEVIEKNDTSPHPALEGNAKVLEQTVVPAEDWNEAVKESDICVTEAVEGAGVSGAQDDAESCRPEFSNT